MKALSLTRPWSELVIAGIKTVENRSWSTPYRGTLVIHAAQSWDDAALRVLDELVGDGMLTTDGFDRLDTTVMHKGAPTGFLGVVTVVDVHHSDALTCTSIEDFDICSPWAFVGSHHWQVTDARRFPDVIDGPGRLGLFDVPDTVLAALDALPLGGLPL
jgi:hypothetical protein